MSENGGTPVVDEEVVVLQQAHFEEEKAVQLRRPTIGDTVMIRDTATMREFFSDGIGREFVIRVDAEDRQPYQVEGRNVWLHESDVVPRIEAEMADLEMPRRLSLLNRTGLGLTAKHQGMNARPPVDSKAACCEPLSYDTPVTELRMVAGLRYEFGLNGNLSFPNGNLYLSNDRAVVRLRLMHAIVHDDSDCYDTPAFTNFAGEFSSVDGQNPAFVASDTVNVWKEVRIPYSGQYGLCYATDGDQTQPTWAAVSNINISAFGAAEWRTKYWCAAELNSTCMLTVKSAEPTSRLMFIARSGRCGFAGNELDSQPFHHQTSLPTIQQDGIAHHSMGGYTSSSSMSQTFRVCFCHDYEYDIAAGGTGFCMSSDVQDFSQALGYLYLVTVRTVPENVYNMLRFTLNISCGEADYGGCEPSFDVRMRLIDIGSDGKFGDSGTTDLCRTAQESASYLLPPNCPAQSGGSPLSCQLPPTISSRVSAQDAAFSAKTPLWYLLTVKGLLFNGLPRAQQLGVCYCNGAASAGEETSTGSNYCLQPEGWFRVGTVVIDPIVVLPDPVIMGRPTNLQLYGPSGGWTKDAGKFSQTLKFIYSVNSTVVEPNCSSIAIPEGTLRNFQCDEATRPNMSSIFTCTRPNMSSLDGPVWEDIVALRPGYYAVCYCDMDCHFDIRWSLLKMHLVAGPASMYAGTQAQGTVLYVGTRFSLTVFGHGFSNADRLLFLRQGSFLRQPDCSIIDFHCLELPSVRCSYFREHISSWRDRLHPIRS
jgi:hypothetical protein